MYTSIEILLVLATVLANASISATYADEEDPASVIDKLVSEAIESGKTVGLSVAVARGDSPIYAKAFGLANVELNVPATDETVFRIGSITKVFTAAAVLVLVEDGKVELDAPISKYLPDYPEHGASIKVRQLLNHTSGVVDFTRLPDYRKDRPLDVTQEEVLDRFQNLPLDFPPGTKHRYCNSGYVLLALIIEKASGESYREFVEQRLFAKLELNRTYCDAAFRIIPNRASGYTTWGGKLRNGSHVSLSQTTGAGNLASTATDLVAWQRGLMKHRLIKCRSVREMTQRGKLDDGRPFNYGLGVRVTKFSGRSVIRHAGGIAGFRGDLAFYPEDEITIAVLANNDRFNASKLSDRIAAKLLTSASKKTD